jgi:hypothetical protein
LALLALCASLLFSPSESEARRPRPKPKANITKALKELKWDMGHRGVIAFLEKGVTKKYEEAVKAAADDLEIDALRRKEKEEKAVIKAGYIRFTGQRTGYEVSVLKDDFAHNNSETMLRFDEGSVQRYYFFRYDKLWKVMVVYPSTSSDAFKQLISQVKGSYGRPKKVNWETPYGGARRMVEAIWQDDQTQMVIEDKSAFYSRFVMRFISLAAGREIQDIHEKKKAVKEQNRSSSASKIGVDIFADEDKTDDVVDQITGTKHEVNMNRLQELKADGE